MQLYQFLWPNSWDEFVAKFQSPLYIADICLGFVMVCIITFFVFKFIRSRFTRALYIIFLFLFYGCIISGLIVGAAVSGFLILLMTLIVLIVSSAEIKSIMLSDLGWRAGINSKANKEKGNSEVLINALEESIINMSKNKCGALITIERKDKIGVDRFSRFSDLDCEVTPEILETIFFKGSPLHDGATIIREGKIIRAGVIFDSVSVSGAAMPGSLGSRHRAALGITEAFDCICITVSEETGSIHICDNGIIRKCYVSNFKETLLEVLDED